MGVWHSDPASNGSNASIGQSLLKDFPEFVLALSTLLQNGINPYKKFINCLELWPGDMACSKA